MSTILVNPQESFNISQNTLGVSGNSLVALKKSYKIVLKKDEDGRLVARSPDLQGVVTDGANIEEAQRNAMEAVAAIIEARNLDKDYIVIIEYLSGV